MQLKILQTSPIRYFARNVDFRFQVVKEPVPFVCNENSCTKFHVIGSSTKVIYSVCNI